MSAIIRLAVARHMLQLSRLTAAPRRALSAVPPVPVPPRPAQQNAYTEPLFEVLKKRMSDTLTARVIALCAVLGTTFSFASYCYDKRIPASLWTALAFPDLKMKPIIEDEKKRVHRPALEEAILARANAEVGMSYLAVVGPRGAGKSTVVQFALAARPGVIVIKLNETDVSAELEIAKKLGFASVPKDLGNIMRDLGRKHLSGGKQLVVVTELERSASPSTIAAAVVALKQLGSDEKACKVIIVMSDANAAFNLPQNEPRRRFLWVGAMSLNEFTAYVATVGLFQTDPAEVTPEDAAANKALIARIYNAGFTSPAAFEDLLDVLPKGANANDPTCMKITEAIMDKNQESAAKQVNGLVNDNPLVPYPAIYSKLLAACEAEDARRAGLSAEELANLPPVTEFAGIPDESLPGMPAAKILAGHLKDRHALQFHPNTETVHFASVAHRRAAAKALKARE